MARAHGSSRSGVRPKAPLRMGLVDLPLGYAVWDPVGGS